MSRWQHTVVVEDEYGRPETWTLNFRRMTARLLVETQAFLSTADDRPEASVLAALADRLCRSVECNGVEVDDKLDVPVSVLTSVPSFHPDFGASDDGTAQADSSDS